MIYDFTIIFIISFHHILMDIKTPVSATIFQEQDPISIVEPRHDSVENTGSGNEAHYYQCFDILGLQELMKTSTKEPVKRVLDEYLLMFLILSTIKRMRNT